MGSVFPVHWHYKGQPLLIILDHILYPSSSAGLVPSVPCWSASCWPPEADQCHFQCYASGSANLIEAGHWWNPTKTPTPHLVSLWLDSNFPFFFSLLPSLINYSSSFYQMCRCLFPSITVNPRFPLPPPISSLRNWVSRHALAAAEKFHQPKIM